MDTMKRLLLDTALLPDGWANQVELDIDERGTIVNVTCSETTTTSGERERVSGVTIPGMPNVHSHAFQRLMAGLAEFDGGGENFWAWRTVMYDFANRIEPQDLLAIAAQLYVDMLKFGYTAVGEFHYLHHNCDGSTYLNRAEMSFAVLEAARQTGIGLTLLPVLYMTSGFDKARPTPLQRRFANDLEGWLEIVRTIKEACRGNAQFQVGAAFHSLRAVPLDFIKNAIDGCSTIDVKGPFHMHCAEQLQEVDDCVATTGERPVERSLAHLPINDAWCIVHATHMTQTEVAGLAQTGAVVGICPTTEANLGDGIFPFESFHNSKGLMGIGSDSNVSVSPTEELRCLDYVQRLISRRRLVLGRASEAHVGTQLWQMTASAGAKAIGQALGVIAPGYRCDLVVLDGEHPSLVGHGPAAWLDGWVFASAGNPVQSVMVGGNWLVREGRHRDEESIAEAYRAVVNRLM